MTATRCQVLLVDDDPAICSLVHAVLTDEGYVACVVSNGECALAVIRRDSPDLVLLDVIRHDQPVESVVAAARALKPGIAIVLFTAMSATEAALVQARLPDVGLLRKPFELDELLAIVQDAVVRSST